jgi:hypothetical protein
MFGSFIQVEKYKKNAGNEKKIILSNPASEFVKKSEYRETSHPITRPFFVIYFLRLKSTKP